MGDMRLLIRNTMKSTDNDHKDEAVQNVRSKDLTAPQSDDNKAGDSLHFDHIPLESDKVHIAQSDDEEMKLLSGRLDVLRSNKGNNSQIIDQDINIEPDSFSEMLSF